MPRHTGTIGDGDSNWEDAEIPANTRDATGCYLVKFSEDVRQSQVCFVHESEIRTA